MTYTCVASSQATLLQRKKDILLCLGCASHGLLIFCFFFFSLSRLPHVSSMIQVFRTSCILDHLGTLCLMLYMYYVFSHVLLRFNDVFLSNPRHYNLTDSNGKVLLTAKPFESYILSYFATPRLHKSNTKQSSM